MPDKLVELASKTEYGYLVVLALFVMGGITRHFVRKMIKSFENLRAAVFGSESEEGLGLNSRVSGLEEWRDESKDELRVELEDAKNEREKLKSEVDEKLAIMADSIKTLTDNLTNTNNDMTVIKEHLSYIRGCFDGKAQEENSQARNRRAGDN